MPTVTLTDNKSGLKLSSRASQFAYRVVWVVETGAVCHLRVECSSLLMYLLVYLLVWQIHWACFTVHSQASVEAIKAGASVFFSKSPSSIRKNTRQQTGYKGHFEHLKHGKNRFCGFVSFPNSSHVRTQPQCQLLQASDFKHKYTSSH